MLPGAGKPVPLTTVKWLADEEPHALFAVTDIVPPAVPAVVVMLLVVEVPLQPLGKVQVYDVAPLTDAIA